MRLVGRRVPLPCPWQRGQGQRRPGARLFLAADAGIWPNPGICRRPWGPNPSSGRLARSLPAV